MRKVTVCGHFAFGQVLLNGQTVKTKILTEQLEFRLGKENVHKIDTHGSKLRGLLAAVSAAFSMFSSRNLVILPAHNGIRVFGPLLGFLRRFSKCRLHYAVIGGWLPQLLKEDRRLCRSLKKFDCIYVETTVMQRAMEELGFENILVMPNCKKLEILKTEDLVYHFGAPYPVCTFSRVMEEKGIADAVEVVKTINERAGETVYTLDIYGQVEPDREEWFDAIQRSFPEYVRYRGSVAFDESVAVLKDYFVLLFPTRFFTEGIPGTIIDGYAAGVPVVSTDWESCGDIVDEKTGFVVEFGSRESLLREMIRIAREPELVTGKKQACLYRAQDFTADTVINTIASKLSE